MEQETQVNNNDTESNLPSKSDEDKSVNWWTKSTVLIAIPVIFLIFIAFNFWRYQSSMIQMSIPGKMTLEFTYPSMFFLSEKRESTLRFNLLDKTLNLKPTVILRPEEDTHIIHILEKDGKLSDRITLEPSKPGMVINVRITEKKWAEGCKFQLEAQTGGVSGVQYSEVHSISVLPTWPKYLALAVGGLLALVALTVDILNKLGYIS